MIREELVNKTVSAVKTIKENSAKGVIRGNLISNLADVNTGKYTGVQVTLELGTKFDYEEWVLKKWKNILGADSYYICVRNRKLLLHYKVHNTNIKQRL